MTTTAAFAPAEAALRRAMQGLQAEAARRGVVLRNPAKPAGMPAVDWLAFTNANACHAAMAEAECMTGIDGRRFTYLGVVQA